MPSLRFYVDRLIQIYPFNNHYKLGQCESYIKTNVKAVIRKKNKQINKNKKQLKAILTVVNECLTLNSA